jgi:iron complex outermembrane receptor protein
MAFRRRIKTLQSNSMRQRLLATSMICGAALLASQAQAQNASEVSEIVVTGSRIPQPNLTSVSPITAINASDIKAQGVTRVEDMINSLPQAFASQGSMISNGASGTATVNLRGLGSSRTLVLVDGRRLMPGDPGTSAADLNFIPAALVERVEVLTGGASSAYGADAVAGVVNFMMQRNFEGVRFDVQYSTYQHKNDNDGIQSIIKAKQATAADKSQFVVPSSNVWDGDGVSVSLAFGANTSDDRGNITAYAVWRQNNPILQGNRDYSTCTFFSGDAFTCGGSGTASPARFGGFVVDPAGPGNTFRARTGADVYNYGPTNYYQRPDERYNLGAFAHYDIADWATAYMDVMFMDDRSVAQIAPGGVFAATFNVNCDNALMTLTQQTQLCGATAGTATLKSLIVAKRNVEGGARQSDIRHTSYRIVTGVKGDLNENWSYDAYLQYSSLQSSETRTGYFLTRNIQNALIARRNAAGQIVCQSVIDGTDSACVPYNIYQLNGVTQAALDYLQVDSGGTGELQQRVASAAVTGQLGDYGIKSPFAEEGIGVAFGAEYREEYSASKSDYVAAQGLLSGTGGASPPVSGGFDVYELFGEARIPLVEDLPFIQKLSLELGYRFSDYAAQNTNTYKIAGDWEVMDGLRVRGGYNRAVRAPNVNNLFAPQNVVLDGTTDPCAGLTASNPLVAKCAQAFNLTTAQVLAIEKNPAPQYNGLTGGNPNLKPETADSYTAGVVYQPSFLPGFNASVDYFNIKVEDAIGGVGADLAITRCLSTLDPFFCGLVKRDAQGSLWLSNQGYIVNTTLNTGSTSTAGVDVNLGYRRDLADLGMGDNGSLSFDFVGTWLDYLKTEPLPGDPEYDCVKLYGTVCGTPNPEWRHKFRVNWATPFWGDLQVGMQWRYFSKVTLDAYDSDPQLKNVDLQYDTDTEMAAQSYFDLQASFKVKDNYTVRLGINNVLDEEPPLVGASACPTGSCNGNTYPQVYDAVGRYMFIGLKADF